RRLWIDDRRPGCPLTFDLLLVGHGRVAQRFVSLLVEQSTVRARIVGVATRRHGYRLGRRRVVPVSTLEFIRDALKVHAKAALAVEGWDAAAKPAALANVLLGANITPKDVERRGIGPDTGRLAREARAAGRRVKLVVRADRDGRSVVARVAPEELRGDDLLAG